MVTLYVYTIVYIQGGANICCYVRGNCNDNYTGF